MILINVNNVVSIKLLDNSTAMSLVKANDWESTLASLILTDSDGSKWQWDCASQSFLLSGG